MKICVFSPYDKEVLEKRILKEGIKLDCKKPDFVITYGGDGTILLSEYEYPGVPKIPIRKSSVCSMCVADGLDSVGLLLEKLKTGKYKIVGKEKVEGKVVGTNKRLVGLNEIQIHNKNPRKAVRFKLQIGKKKLDEEIIGDGLIAATAFGSTAYYRALGYDPFNFGIRVGFNNVHPKRNAVRVTGSVIVEITREDAILLADNQKKVINLKAGDKVEIRQSEYAAQLVMLI